ncbi:DNA import protein CedB [Metallosphaera javensis (ex Sakai et al. 2022)]|uniref:DNA import protein CedB n=1 Tax=Metallosphaera javensis (ex Sakai et al. 2022) TaxID=2775498 RepID=UPI0025834EBC|nr:MAG: DNA import protein CedB [Metallosphaera javensis (ex Sakai et al. 2022)]
MEIFDRYTPYVILLLPVILALLYRNPFLLSLLGVVLILMLYSGTIKIPLNVNFSPRRGEASSYLIEKGVVTRDKSAIGVIVVDDIPYDYRDLSDSSLRASINAFHKITNIGEHVDIIFRKKYIDQKLYTERLLNKLQNLRIIIENDPSNARAKKEMELLQAILSRLEQGEKPFSYQVVLLIHGKDKQEARSLGEVLIRGLESLNIKSRFATVREIEDILSLGLTKFRGEGLPSQIPFLTPFSLEKMPLVERWGDGIYIGKDMERQIPVFWNIERSENSHIMIIGPSGAGKTELLIWLGSLMSLQYSIPVIFFDVKGDIRTRLKRYGFSFRVLNPFFYSLKLLDSPYVAPSIKPLFLEKIIGVSFKLDREERAILFNVLNRHLGEVHRKPEWRTIIKDEEIANRYSIRRSLELVDAFDSDGPFIMEGITNGINVIDLTQLKDETLRRFVIYSFISVLYANYSSDADVGLRVGIVVDEAWTILKEDDEYGIIGDLVKRGRGHGISLLMATQNIQDLGENADVFMDNIGTLCFMNNGDKNFWREVVKRYSNILDSEVENRLTFLGRGEMLVRFLGDPRPILVAHRPLTGGSLQN